MAATTKAKDLVWRICTALNDASPQYVTYKESEIVMAINDGMTAVCKFVPDACTRIDSLQLQAKSFQSIATIQASACQPADGSTPPTTIYGRQVLDIECNMTNAGTVEGRAVRLASRTSLDADDPDWRSKTGTSVVSYMVNENDPTVFYVTPKPTDTSQWLRVEYAAYPTKIADGNDTTSVYDFVGSNATVVSIDDANIDDVFWYVLARMNLKDTAVAKPPMVQQAINLLVASLNAQVQAQTGKSPNLKGLPDVMGAG